MTSVRPCLNLVIRSLEEAASSTTRYRACRTGRRCRHNLNYWTFGDYLAAGAGAHGKVTTQDGVVREVRHASPRKYMASVSETGSGIAERRAVESGDLPFEFMLNALRLTEGVPAELF